MSASEGSWHSAPQFAVYWQHYKAVQQWTDEHTRVLHRIEADARRSHLPSEMLLPPPPPPPPPPPSFQLHSHRKRKRYAPDCAPMAVELALAPTASSRDDDYGDAEMAEPTEEVEMSDEMIAFFRKTMEHRMERDKSRVGVGAEEQNENADEQQPSSKWLVEMNDYVSADQVGVSGLSEASLLPPQLHKAQATRREEAKRQYGADAEKILAMETLMQMRFDQEYDKTKPPLWPNIPLNL